MVKRPSKPKKDPARIVCRNCKERGVKCSGERPTCRTCANSNRTCRGYGDDSPSAQRSLSEDGSLNSAVAHITPRHAFRQQLISAFLDDYMPAEHTTAAYRGRFWLVDVARTAHLTPHLEATVLAVCTARLGFRDGNNSLVQNSLVLYGNGLAQLQKAIDHPALRLQEQTLATCVAFTMYEFSKSTEPSRGEFAAHYNGTTQLMQLRGPTLHASGLGYAILRALRVQSMYQGLERRKPTILARKEWLEVPWAARPPKDAHDQAIDIILKLPAIYAHDNEADNEQASFADRLAANLRRIWACWRIDKEMTAWLEISRDEYGSTPYWPAPTILTDSETASDEPYALQYDFASHMAAQTMIKGWLAQMLLYHHLCQAYRALRKLVATRPGGEKFIGKCICPTGTQEDYTACPEHFALDQLPPLGFRDTWPETVGANLCQSVQYFLQPKWKSGSIWTMALPLQMLKGFLQEDPVEDRLREIAWITGTMAHMETLLKEPPSKR
ncbi:hypothetical protein GQ53DRAFT_835169 [Thozetella sp. PMI_491]|nr:hypothetical protein GQ53DRAFT_835169 [Thozetella sp. PMI_491]